MYIMMICHWAILHYNMSFKTIAGRSDGVFWWFPAVSEDQDFLLSNSPKLSCGFNDAELDQCVMYPYLSCQPSSGGGEVDLWDDGGGVRRDLRVGVPGRHEQTEVLVVVDHLLADLDHKPRTWGDINHTISTWCRISYFGCGQSQWPRNTTHIELHLKSLKSM